MEMLADSESSDRYITTALLEADSHGEEGTQRNRRSWKKAYLDVDEAKKQVLYIFDRFPVIFPFSFSGCAHTQSHAWNNAVHKLHKHIMYGFELFFFSFG